MKRCIIVGGADINNFNWINNHITADDYIIYCDSGLYHMEKLKGEPGLIVGDFDSHPEPHMDVETIKLPVEKDDTDTVYAVKEAIRRGYTDFVIIGALGKRFDHTLGNLAILLFLESRNLKGMVLDDYSEITVISGYENAVPAPTATSIHENAVPAPTRIADNCKYFSLLCAGGPAQGITITGAKYSLENADLTMEFPLGVSNEVLPGQTAEVTLRKGRLFLIKIVDKNA